MGCENALGIMTKLQTSLVAEETWVDGAAEKLSALPTATSALELDVSISPPIHPFIESSKTPIILSLRILYTIDHHFYHIITLFLSTESPFFYKKKKKNSYL